MILDSPIISGSSTVTGDLTVLGTLTANVSGSTTSASYAANAETLDGLDSTSFVTTSSFNAVSGSFSTRVTNLESFSSSLDATFATDAQLAAVSQSLSSSLSIVSGSLSSRVANNEATGSSLTTASGSFSIRVTNNEATGSSLVTASGSFSTRVTNTEATASSLVTASGSFSTRTTNLETASGSFSTRTTNLETASGSFSTRVTSAEGSISSLNSKSGSYATTGSNNFNGNQVITGSLTTTGTITAQTLNVQQVTSSIVYSSGSNIFGNSVSNTQQFTGSLQVSGSNHYLLGNLGVNTTNPGEKLTVNGGLGFQYNGTQNWHINSNSSNDLLFTRSGIAERMTITSDGGVGIGTTNPGSYKLNVNGESAFQDHVTVNSAKYIYTNNIGANSTSTNLVIAGPSSAHIVLTTSNVGIGTTSPGGLLHLDSSNSGAAGQQMLRITRNSVSQGIKLMNYDGGTGVDGYSLKTIGDIDLIHFKMDGRIGIGTTTPSAKLAINDSATVTNTQIDLIGNSSVSKGHIGQFADSLYLTSNWYYNGTQNNDTGSRGQASITIAAGATTTSHINFALSDAGSTSPSSKMYINSSGNVGIGTTSPSTKLYVLSADADYAGIFKNTNTSGYGLQVYTQGSSTNLAFQVRTNNGSTNAFQVLDNGNVGIGTTAPDLTLSINGAMNLRNSTRAGAFEIDSSGNLWVGTATTAGNIYLETGHSTTGLPSTGTARITINSTGVGIGTTSPGARLDLGSSSNGNRVTWDKYSNVFSEYSSGDLWLSSNFYGNLGSSGYVTSTTATFGAAGIAVSGTGGGLNGVIKFFVDNAASKTAGASFTPSERMRITGNGDIGIGTTSPIGKQHNIITSNGTALYLNNSTGGGGAFVDLDFGTYTTNQAGYANAGATIRVIDDGNFSGHITFRTKGGAIGASQTEQVRIQSNGNVGIGTTSPSEKLDVGGNIRLFKNGSSFTEVIFADPIGGYPTWVTGKIASYYTTSPYGSDLRFYTNTGTSATDFSEKMRIQPNGNVGIGTTSPTSTLDINGSVRYRGSIYDQFNYVASGNFNNGTYYNIVGVNQIASGIYILEGYIDTYAAGGGIYFMRFVSVPFYMWDVGSNSVTFQDLPPVLGTGHHRGDSFPTFRLQLTLAGAGVYLQFNPNATWSGMDNSSGKTFQVNLKRIGS